MASRMKTQKDDIARYLKKNPEGITSWEAFEMFGATRLSAIVWCLRHEDKMKIESERVKVKTRYGKTVSVARYRLADAS